MTTTLRLLLSAALIFSSSLYAADAGTSPQKIIIIKADDVRGSNSKWDRFIAVSKDRGVRVSIGLIGNSLEKPDPVYARWLVDQTATGQVEFWHHGWDHKSWQVDDKKLSEFGGSGYEHQKQHLTKTQTVIQPVLGKPFNTFGSPYNALDADTASALNEHPELTLIFAYASNPSVQRLTGKTILPMELRGEHDGTGKPNFPKFKEEYAKKAGNSIPVSALQFHPLGFSEEGFKHYTDILDFLKTEGWTFMLPSEYAGAIQSPVNKK